MRRKLIIDGNTVYEIDEECMLQKCLREPDMSVEKRGDNIQKGRQEQTNHIEKYYFAKRQK